MNERYPGDSSFEKSAGVGQESERKSRPWWARVIHFRLGSHMVRNAMRENNQDALVVTALTTSGDELWEQPPSSEEIHDAITKTPRGEGEPPQVESKF